MTSGVTRVLIGGVAGRMLFSGLAPGFVGLWQVNAEIAPNTPVGGAVPIRISVGTADSNEAAISVR